MNQPNEPGAWDADFSYRYLERLYQRLRSGFDLGLIGDVPETAGRPLALIRHDLDVSMDRAYRLAERESAWGIRSTYHVMIDSPLYDITSEQATRTIRAIADMGHEVGLHYDVVARKTRDSDPATRANDIDAACRSLEEVVASPVRSISFHRPITELFRGPLLVAGRVSGYASELFQWYLSDSRARWREGEPIKSIRTPRSDILQILIHPIWWGEDNLRPAERLRGFLLELEPTATPRRYEQLRTILSDHIDYRAAEL